MKVPTANHQLFVPTPRGTPLARAALVCHDSPMPKRNKQSGDVSQLAHRLVAQSTGQEAPLPTKSQISALMARLGRKGGKIGGKRRLETMSAEERRRVAKKAAEARWGTKN